MIIAVDFDGTLVHDAFPTIGKPYRARIRACKRLQNDGHKLILWTCRTDKMLEEAVQFCKTQGLYFDAVNKNLPEVIEKWGGDTRKVFCDYYIDDKSLADSVLDGKLCGEWTNP